MQYEQELLFAKELARTAGEMMRAAFGLHTNATWKEDNSPITETDIAINQLVIDGVQARFPDDGVLGEETSYRSERNRLWVVDPIDGTQPFAVGMPLSTFCLAFVVGGIPTIGVVYDPYQDRLFSAVIGGGAFINNEQIRVSSARYFEKNYVILSSRMAGEWPTPGQVYDAISERQGKVFNLRSVVYGMMLVACGRAVASVAGYLHPWDIAAAQVILQEAGATVTDLRGQPLHYNNVANGFLATNGKVHEAMLAVVKK